MLILSYVEFRLSSSLLAWYLPTSIILTLSNEFAVASFSPIVLTNTGLSLVEVFETSKLGAAFH